MTELTRTALAALEQLERQDPRFVYAARPGICGSVRVATGQRIAFRRCGAEVQMEVWNGTNCEEFSLPKALQERAGKMLDRL